MPSTSGKPCLPRASLEQRSEGSGEGGHKERAVAHVKERTRLGSSWAQVAQSTGPPPAKVTFERDDATATTMPSPTSIDADLSNDTPRGRGTNISAATAMKERVIKGRIVGMAVVEQRARAIAQPDFDQYMADLIDEATLKQRKSEAREKAIEECVPLATLDLAFTAFADAVKARVDASLLYAKAEVAEDAAEAKLVAALQQVEFESLEKAAGDWWLSGAP
jgi:hypothetical protein